MIQRPLRPGPSRRSPRAAGRRSGKQRFSIRARMSEGAEETSRRRKGVDEHAVIESLAGKFPAKLRQNRDAICYDGWLGNFSSAQPFQSLRPATEGAVFTTNFTALERRSERDLL